jgi:hypothetical protein
MSIVATGLLALPMYAAPRIPVNSNNRAPAQVGTVNYIEGQATLDGQALNQNSVGTVMQTGQTLATQNGKAELLLTPGVFLRLNSGSAVQMNQPGLANTVVTLTQGQAIVEADQVQKDNDIIINENGIPVRLMKKGLYEFDATSGQVRVFDGQADVTDARNKKIEIKGGHELQLNQPKLKTRGFDKKAYENTELYRWASLRSSYLAEANASTAREYVNGGAGWYGPGWYWNPWFTAYTWIPGDGIFWGPFGYGFFSPWYVGYAPLYFGYGYGYGYYHGFGPGYRAPVVAGHGFVGGPRSVGARGGFTGGGFHSGFAGGGFHGGFAGGGFHGGGFGGGRR